MTKKRSKYRPPRSVKVKRNPSKSLEEKGNFFVVKTSLNKFLLKHLYAHLRPIFEKNVIRANGVLDAVGQLVALVYTFLHAELGKEEPDFPYCNQLYDTLTDQFFENICYYTVTVPGEKAKCPPGKEMQVKVDFLSSFLDKHCKGIMGPKLSREKLDKILPDYELKSLLTARSNNVKMRLDQHLEKFVSSIHGLHTDEFKLLPTDQKDPYRKKVKRLTNYLKTNSVPIVDVQEGEEVKDESEEMKGQSEEMKGQSEEMKGQSRDEGSI